LGEPPVPGRLAGRRPREPAADDGDARAVGKKAEGIVAAAYSSSASISGGVVRAQP
jgi:hypothetical protein